MRESTTIADIRRCIGELRAQHGTVGFVPTMGNLHEGHLALVKHALASSGTAVVSIYVNPLQFGAGEDLAGYPRTLEQDREALEQLGVAAVFVPDETVMYPRGPERQTRVTVPGLGDILEGEFRPGHFQGVATVVARLLNIVRPDVAVFGRKDYQQLKVIERMVEDLAIPVEIEGVETTRAPDGLALSSRNQYLSPGQRSVAPVLYQVLSDCVQQVRSGDEFAGIQRRGLSRLKEKGFRPDYLEIRNQGDLSRPGQEDADLVVLAAAHLGRARLIDNLEFTR